MRTKPPWMPLGLLAMMLGLGGCSFAPDRDAYRRVTVENLGTKPVTSVLMAVGQNELVFGTILPGGRKRDADFGSLPEGGPERAKSLQEPLVLAWRDEGGAWHRHEFRAPLAFYSRGTSMEVKINEHGVVRVASPAEDKRNR